METGRVESASGRIDRAGDCFFLTVCISILFLVLSISLPKWRPLCSCML